jgi:FKBP-type peptidyl-prolyl cis-trans isomerase
LPIARRLAALLVAALAAACGNEKEAAPAAPTPPRETPPVAAPPVAEAPGKPAAPAIPADTEIVTLPSGLKYSVLKEGGPGPKPKLGDMVKVHYTGWLTDGKTFDSSRDRGEPTEFELGKVIKGWNEGLGEMTAGARWKLTIPPDLAYGPDGAPPVIPPGATLVFDVELLSFRAAPAFRAPDPAAQKATASGLRYEVCAPGEGEGPAPEDACEIAYTLYDAKGNVLQSSELTGKHIVAKAAEMQLPFLREAPALMKQGAEFQFEVPPELCWGDKPMGNLPPKSTTHWRLRMVRVGKVRPAPAFEMPPADKLETTPSGLQIWIVKPGAGDSPAMGENVVVDYAGWLTDGTLFDDSFKRGMPATFAVGQLIPGWNEALLRLKPGAMAWLVVPGPLAYGPRGQGKIPPNATLVFRLELHEVRK